MRDKKKQMTAEQLFGYAMRMLGQGSAFLSAPILQHLRTGPLPTFQTPRQPFKRRATELAKQRRRHSKALVIGRRRGEVKMFHRAVKTLRTFAWPQPKRP